MARADGWGIVGADSFVAAALVTRLETEQCDRRLQHLAPGGGTRDTSPAACLEGVGSVLHLAALTAPRASPEAFHEANVARPLRWAQAAADAGVRRFVHLSSMSVLGKSAPAPLGPQAALRPESEYGRSRAAGEEGLLELSFRTGMPVSIIRSPMVYGEPHGGFEALLRLVKSGLPLPFGLATAPRSFCSIANLASAIVHVASCDRAAEVIMPADPTDLSAREICLATRQAGAGRSALVPVPPVVMRTLLSLAGKADMYRSLFEPMQIDRAHWRDWNWAPHQGAGEGVAAAVGVARDSPRRPGAD